MQAIHIFVWETWVLWTYRHFAFFSITFCWRWLYVSILLRMTDHWIVGGGTEILLVVKNAIATRAVINNLVHLIAMCLWNQLQESPDPDARMRLTFSHYELTAQQPLEAASCQWPWLWDGGPLKLLVHVTLLPVLRRSVLWLEAHSKRVYKLVLL